MHLCNFKARKIIVNYCVPSINIQKVSHWGRTVEAETCRRKAMNTVLSLCTLLASILVIKLDKMLHKMVQYLETCQDRPVKLLSTSSFTKCYNSLHFRIFASKKTPLTKPRINEAWKTAVPMSKLRIMITFYTVPLFFFPVWCGAKSNRQKVLSQEAIVF
jgi:hypothetical protein